MAEVAEVEKQETKAGQGREVSGTQPGTETQASGPSRAMSTFSEVERKMEQAFQNLFNRRWLRPKRAETYSSPIDEMERMMERAMQNVFPQDLLRSWRSEMPNLADFSWAPEMRIPAVDVIDREDSILVRAEVPGFEAGDMEVFVSGNRLNLRGKSRREEKKEEGDYYRSEISQNEFSRSLDLPSEVDGDKTTAKIRNGVLEVTIPKLEKSKRLSIPIES